MTSKTFNSESRRSMSMEIHQCDGTIPDEYIVQFMDGDNVLKSFYYKKSDAPAQALAILEAAGYTGITASKEPDNLIEKAYSAIRLHIKEQERATAEAEAQAKLEAEAFNLYRAYMDIHEPMNAIGGWHMLAEHTKENWLAFARKAREMRAEK